MLLPGTEHRADACRLQEVVVPGRDHPADHDDDVARTLRGQLFDQLGNERLVAGRLARDADDVHVVLDRIARGFFRRLEQRTDVDVEAEIGEGRRDHLGAAVVTVLAQLRDEDARPASFVLGEVVDLLADALELLVVGVRTAVHT